jgi:predicted ABC-type ATPase
MSQARWLWFIAGPNGAGKSTRAAEFLGGLGEIVNPDEIAREMSAAPEEALGAGRAAIDRRKELLKAGNSFSLETTLSGRTLIRLAQAAKDEGWKVGLLYFGLRSPEQAIRTRSASSEIGRP